MMFEYRSSANIYFLRSTFIIFFQISYNISIYLSCKWTCHNIFVSFLGEDPRGFVSIEVPLLSGYELDERKSKEGLEPILRNLLFKEGDDVYAFLLQVNYILLMSILK